MSVHEYGEWMKVEEQLKELRKQKDLEQMEKFRGMVSKSNRQNQFSLD